MEEFDAGILAARQFVEEHKDRLDEFSTIEVIGLAPINQPDSSEQDLVKLFSFLVIYPVEIALLQIKLPRSYALYLRSEVHPEEGSAVRVDILLEAEPRRLKDTRDHGDEEFWRHPGSNGPHHGCQGRVGARGQNGSPRTRTCCLSMTRCC